jgi:hypothetical protein
MCWLTAEWVTLISWAACVTLPRRATASKLRRLATGKICHGDLSVSESIR